MRVEAVITIIPEYEDTTFRYKLHKQHNQLVIQINSNVSKEKEKPLDIIRNKDLYFRLLHVQFNSRIHLSLNWILEHLD